MNTTYKEKPAAGHGGRSGATIGTVRRIYFNTSGRPVATLQGAILHKRVRGSLHQLRQPPGWAIDRAILEAAKRDGARFVEVFDIERRLVYTASIETFDRFGIPLDRGHGAQMAVPLTFWRVEAEGARQLTLLEVHDG